jgi:nucleoside-diphosphate-sugar epimerase
MRYFVTGATGFIGGRVARRLVEAGHQVVALVRTPAKANELRDGGVELVAGDITDRESMRHPMTGVDGVFHIAAWYKVGARDKHAAQRINVEGTRNVLELMRDLKIPKGVYTSTLAVFGDTHGQIVDENYRYDGPHLSEYDRTKWAAHYEVALPMIDAGLPLVIVQPGLNYGPGDTSSVRDTLLQYLKGELLLMPQQTAYCWAHVDDTVAAHLLAMDKGRSGETYITAGPLHSLIEALLIAEKLTGIKAPRLRPVPQLLTSLARVVEPIEKFVSLPDLYTSESLRVIAGVTYLGSSAKAERELGFRARPLDEGLGETLAHEMKLLGMQPSYT